MPSSDVTVLTLDISRLRSSLVSFQNDLGHIKSQQSQTYHGALEHVYGEFGELVEDMAESDAHLIRRSRRRSIDPEELMRNCTAAALERTKELGEQLSTILSSYEEELGILQSLDEDVAHFAISQVARCQHELEHVVDKCGTEITVISSQINAADLNLRQTKTKILELQSSIADAGRRASSHKTARNVGITVCFETFIRECTHDNQLKASVGSSLMTLGTIGLAIAFPPAGAAAALGVLAGSIGGVAGGITGGVLAAYDTERPYKSVLIID
jgi:hypothetical protein